MIMVRKITGARARALSPLLPLAACLLCCGDPPTGPEPAPVVEPAPTPEPQPAPEADAAPEKMATLRRETMKKLAALGYFDRAPAIDREKAGVTLRDDRAHPGLNLYTSRHKAEAVLVDMKGRVVHSWHDRTGGNAWMHVELLPNGDMLAIAKSTSLALYSWGSRLRWRKPSGAHHDLDLLPDGRIAVLTHGPEEYPFEGIEIPVQDDNIEFISRKGRGRRMRPLFPVLRQLATREQLLKIKWRAERRKISAREVYRENSVYDVTHANSIEVLPRDLPDVAPAGSYLLSLRELNQVAILDAKLEEILWSWGRGELEEQHHATLVKGDNIMIFDNGTERERSRVIEVDPRTGKIVWSYSEPGFFTRLRGAAQQLPNGNVLITESDEGHVFEVTRDGDMVWEFWNPDIIGDDEEATRATIYRMTRYPIDYLEAGLLPAPSSTTSPPPEKTPGS